MIIFKFISAGYFVLIFAIFSNAMADFLNICTWYKFIQQIFENGISDTICQQSILSLVWLFVIYPIILSLGYLTGEKMYFFIIQ